MVLEKTLESPLDCKEIQPVYPKGDQSWVFIGRTDVEAETPILWPPDMKSLLIWTDPDAGKDWRQDEKGTTEDEMVRWHHRLNEHGFGWTLGVGDGQGGPACCSSWGRKELDTTEQLNWMKRKKIWYTHTRILLSAKTRMNLEGIMLSEMSQRKTNTVWPHLYVESEIKQQAHRHREDWRLPGLEAGGGKNEWRSQKAQISTYEIHKSQRYNGQHSDYC